MAGGMRRPVTLPTSRPRRAPRPLALAVVLWALLAEPLAPTTGVAAHVAVPLPPSGEDRGPSSSRGVQAQPDEPIDAGEQGPSVQYRQAEAHAGDLIGFEPGGLVTVPFVPRTGDRWQVDSTSPRPLPAGFASGLQMRDTVPGRAWAAGVPAGVTAPGRSEAREGATAAAADAAEVPAPADAVLTAARLDPAAKLQETARVSSDGLRREVFGFLPYWEVGNRSTVLDWRTLSTVAYFSVGCMSNGSLLKRNPDGSATTGWAGWTGSKMTSVINTAHQHQTRVVLTITCFAWSTAGAVAQAALLGSPAARATLARQVAAAVRDRGADGVNLDFEPLVAGYADQFARLVRSVRAELNAIAPGYQLTFDAMGSIGNQPIAEATAPGGADAVFIMGYDYRTAAASVAGSISPLAGPAYDLADTIKAFTALVPPSKLILGVPWYGRAWSTPTNDLHAPNISGSRYGGTAEPPYAQAADLLAAYGRRWDAVEQAPWTAYRKRTCTAAYGCVTSWRELYVDDAKSLKLRYDLINRSSLRGVGIWALGYDNTRPELRAALADKFLADRTAPLAGIVTLAPRQRDEGFRVAWSAYDESAIRGYDVQVSIDGGAWAAWQTATTASSSIYLGGNGHTYAFRVRATDVHGNVSAWRSLPLGALGAPKAIGVGGFAAVVADGLRLRASPSTDAEVMTRFDAGDTLQVIGGPASGNGYTWYQVAGPVRQWGPVDSMQVGGWVAAFGNGVTNAAPRSPVYATRVDAGIADLRLNGGRPRVLTPNGDGVDDALHLTWTNRRALDSLALRVFRADGTLVGSESLGPGRRIAGPNRFDWDGRIDGTRVPSGTYVVQLRGVDGANAYSAPSSSPVNAAQLARWGVVIGRSAPTSVIAFGSAPVSPTRARSVTYSLRFGGPVRDLSVADFTRAGTARGCSLRAPIGSGATWSLTVAGCGPGAFVLSLRAGAVVDAVANRGPATQFNAPTVVIDRTAPTTSAPRVKPQTGVRLASTSPSTGLLASLTWTAGDAGVAAYDVRQSVDGSRFADLAVGIPGAALAVSLTPGHAYRFEVRARDRAGNVGGWIASPTVRAAFTQEASPAIRYRGTWGTARNGYHLAGAARNSIMPGASATYTFTGRGIAWVTTLGPDRGVARIYLDGALVAIVDTNAPAFAFRAVAWARTWAWGGTHTLKLVVAGTAGHARVDLDAFEIVR
jgi:spore germination protein YaaH